MKAKSYFLIVVLLLLPISLLLTSPLRGTDEVKTVIRGTVMPYKWIGKRTVAKFAIRVITPVANTASRKGKDEIRIKDYIIEGNHKARELMSLGMVGETVEAKGRVVHKKNNELLFYLEDYKVLKSKPAQREKP
ncbi:MAG: hypothetical protein ACE5G1_14100 [bacterium]